MRLIRQLLVSVAVLVAASCSDATSPRRISETYSLTSIDGRSLPDVDEIITGTEYITTVWGLLTLNEDGTATTLTHVRRVDVGVDSLEYTDSTTFGYRIRGDSIEIEATGTCGELCQQSWHGTVSKSTVTLTDERFPEAAPVYLYSVLQPVPN